MFDSSLIFIVVFKSFKVSISGPLIRAAGANLSCCMNLTSNLSWVTTHLLKDLMTASFPAQVGQKSPSMHMHVSLCLYAVMHMNISLFIRRPTNRLFLLSLYAWWSIEFIWSKDWSRPVVSGGERNWNIIISASHGRTSMSKRLEWPSVMTTTGLLICLLSKSLSSSW